GQFIQYAYPWGYADNHPNDNIRSNFDIGWAVDAQGNKVDLPGIHFVKVYTGVNQYCGLWGETSTEIMGAEDFHIQGIDIDVLGVKTEVLPDARAYYAQGRLHLENLEGCYGTLFSINGQLMSNFQITSSNDMCEINLISGAYLLKVQKQNTIKMFKFVIY
ncbi:MAG: T9SS type A sorting domain-containing protein, partial [Lentimicrobiaceae bacterium]|nr:T9SS type A sorting domain-containing protein [Lentimicrobiaceae bacterium]